MASSLHSVRFPGESAAYRAKRDELLRAEMELRDRIEAVASLRRELPPGGSVKEDYVFDQGASTFEELEGSAPVRLSQLFKEGKDTLIVYGFMYSPAMKRPCTSCTAMLDGLNGTIPHALERVNIAIVAKSPIRRIREFALERRWRNLPLLSSAHNTFNADYHSETPAGDQLPALHVFARRDGEIRHFYTTELLYAKTNPGQDNRHVDSIWPLWSLFDFTPEGRGTDWYPKLAYNHPTARQ
jgi:predicted dithiol-disulfide oxidoreductase (DUF899 family)